MSGSGKTEIIVRLVPELDRLRKRILLVSYSPALIDAMLLKLAAKGFRKFIRIASSLNQVDEELHKQVILPEMLTSTTAVKSLYSSYYIYACNV